MTGANITCMTVHGRLSAYLDDELDSSLKSLMNAHLEQCESCRREEQNLSRLAREIMKLPAIEPAQGFTPRVMAGIRERKNNSFASPSLVYSFVFSIFLIVGIFIAGALMEMGTAQAKIGDNMSSLLAESSGLNLLNIQEQSFALLYSSGKPGNNSYENKK